MEQFKLTPDAFKAVRKRMLFQMPAIFLLSGFTGIYVAAMSDGNRPTNWTFIICGALVLLTFLAFLIPYGLTKQRHICEDFVLTIDDYWITRAQYDADIIEIAKDEITKIYKRSNGTIVIRDSAWDELIIPPQIQEQEKLEKFLSDIMPFSPEPISQKYAFFFVLAGLGLFATVKLSTDRLFVLISGSALVSVYVYLVYIRFRKRNSAYAPKIGILGSLYFLYLIIRIMYSKFTGG